MLCLFEVLNLSTAKRWWQLVGSVRVGCRDWGFSCFGHGYIHIYMLGLAGRPKLLAEIQRQHMAGAYGP